MPATTVLQSKLGHNKRQCTVYILRSICSGQLVNLAFVQLLLYAYNVQAAVRFVFTGISSLSSIAA
jgi:hypothetical protein